MDSLLGIGLTIVGLAVLQRIVICILYNVDYFALVAKSTHITTILDQKGPLITGQIISALLQIWIVLFTIWNLSLSDPVVNTEYVLTIMIGYYIFDLVDMLRYEDGRTMYLIHGHHVLSIMLLTHYQLNPITATIFTKNMTICVLELSAASLNVRNLCRRCFTNSQSIDNVHILIYFITRMMILPMIIYTSIYEQILDNHIWDSVYMAPALGFLLLYTVSILWFQNMMKRRHARI
jgi:hypothetical protein